MFNSVNLGNFCSPSRKERGADFGERGSCASNLYLPSCTYYVPEFSTVSSFLPQAPSRQISYPYPAQVPPVREVSYGLEPSGKWHHRNSYSSCYAAADELMHRECLPPSTVTEILMKNEGSYGGHHHPSAPHAAPAGFYSSVNKNSVLPQAFDRFFDNAYCGGGDASAEPPCPGKGEAKGEPEAPPASGLASRAEAGPEAEADAEEENTNPSSSGSAHSAAKEPAKGAAPSRRPPHPQEALPLFEIPDPGTGARVFLQRVYQQREAAAAVPDAEPDGPTSENLVSEQKDERKKTKQRPAAVFLGKSSAVTADRALWGEGGKGEIILFYFYFLFSNSPSFRGWKTGLWPGLAPTAVARTSFRNLLHLGLTQCGTGTGPGKGGEGKCLIHGEWTPLAPRPRIFI
ncbi:homeobox protein Hox-C11 isoform X1 [Eubalaena glacialis]|uniref:homeobox protein Hox-C11 isoform X1 n=1 Tax=Eubalaena glacialis TaxID=27606 RepID=UPI002A599B93|nr:homeobox protein Hox-C11 isoform X1 [Eubalaena glacialis]